MQFDGVAQDAREINLQGAAVGAHDFDLHRFARRLRRHNHGLRPEIEGDAQDVGVLDDSPLRFRGFGVGVMNSAVRRVSMICCVGWPWLSSSQ